MMRICILNVLVSGALSAMGGSCQNVSGSGTYHFKYNADSGGTVMRWGEDGSLPGQNRSGWGACITPASPATFLTTDWFCDRLQEWTLDGRWKRTIQNHLRSDAQCFKCKNRSGQNQTLYQKVRLTPGNYRVQFLAFTSGSAITLASNDVKPFAAKAATPETNEITVSSANYQNYDLTIVQGQSALQGCFIYGDLTVSTEEDWHVGALVGSNKVVYVASLTCYKTQ